MIRVVHPGSGILDPDADFLPIPDPGSQIQGSKRHRIPDPCQPPPPPEYLLTQDSCKETSLPLLHTTTHNNTTQQHYTTALGYIKLSMYLLFLWRGTLWFSLVPFQGPKKSQFSGPTPSNAPHNDVAPLKIIMYRAIKTTGTLTRILTPSLLYLIDMGYEGRALGYNDFNNMIMQTLWWLPIKILRHIHKKDFPFFWAVSCAFAIKVYKKW